MKRRLPFLNILFLLLGSLFFNVGCASATAIEGIHMTSSEVVEVPYGRFSYEGITVTVDYKNGTNKEIPLEEEMISAVERMKFFKMGSQDVKVTYRSRYETTMPISVILNKFNDVYALEGYECVYDGSPHMVTLNHELPEGAMITYPYGNVFTNAGVYEIKGVISKTGYESKTLTTTLTIHQAQRDAQGIVFPDTTLVYNGEMRTIEATGVPEGVEVSYDTYDFEHGIRINKVVNAGKYRIVAHFTDTSANYEKIPDKEAILTIVKADYDVSGVALDDVTKEYDGTSYEAQIRNKASLPSGISVNYKYLNEAGNPVTTNAKVGTYTIVAEFVGGDLNNYNPIEPLTAKLTVAQRVIKISDKITFESKTVNFDEESTHSLAITGTLPSNVEVTYENNGQVYAGEYEVTARFHATDENETVDVSEMVAYLIINRVRRSVLVYNEATQQFDSEFSAANIKIDNGVASVIGIQTDIIRCTSLTFSSLADAENVDPADFVDGETYKYVAKFEYLDANVNKSVILSDESDNYTYHEA